MAIEERDVEFYQTYQKATPGQSLTNSPNSKYAWEEAPLYTNRHEAEVFILEQLTEEPVFIELMSLVGKGVAIEDITTTYLLNGFSEGLWNADLLILLMESVAFMIMGLAEKVGLDYKLYEGEEEDDELEEINEDYEDEEKKTSLDKSIEVLRNRLKLNPENKEIEQKIEEVPEEKITKVKSLLEQSEEQTEAQPVPEQPTSLLAAE
tara:strand:+ start:3396 stop:4016 length:621 start_codon:yes stop_codon:yes gene_type:complete